MSKNLVRQSLHSQITEYLINLGIWDECLTKELPGSWENYNGFLIFSASYFQNPKWRKAGPGLWKLVCSSLKGHSIAIKDKICNDSFRSPNAVLLYGDSPIVYYLDNGIRYSWNVEKNMFCAGNVTERHRVASFSCQNEVIVDLFSGIGYFTLPFLVHAKAKYVHACEWSPHAVESLRRNLCLNKVEEKCTVYEGDNRLVCPRKVANRVNLGLIPSSEEYWNVACEALIETGGVLYIHNNVTSQLSSQFDKECGKCNKIVTSLNIDISKNMSFPVITFCNDTEMDFSYKFGYNSVKWKHPEWFIFSVHISHVLLSHFKNIYTLPWSVSVDCVFRVKSYAPHIDHLVYTSICKPL